MKKNIYILPNMLTLVGMLFGFLSIIATLKGNYIFSAWAIIIANIFDGLDGFVARLTGSSSRFGIELDSLSDLIAFGAAPSILLYKWTLSDFGRVGVGLTFLFLACGALRLARFNIQTTTSEIKSFTGMPIPAAAMIVASLVLFHYEFHDYPPEKNYFILILTPILSLFMVSTLRFHGLKELNFRSRKPQLILMAFIIILIVVLIHPPIILFTFAIGYLVTGIIENIYLFIKKKKRLKNEKDKDI